MGMAPRETLGEGLAGYELHDEARMPRALIEPVERRDVRMVQGGEDARLAVEPRETLLIPPESLGEDL